jgi:uncharacterized membrane protein (DUF4010 family)
VDRERKSAQEPRTFGGLRTFTLLSLCGATSAWLSASIGSPALLVVALLGVVVLLGVAHVRTEGKPGLTGEVAAILVFLLGAAAVSGNPEIAVVLAITATVLLVFKVELHSMVNTLAPDDVGASLQLLFASFVVLPLLPREPVDPWGAIVPFDLWLLVVLISGLSFAGYVAVRLLHERHGLLVTGVFGGLASSTATTLALARTADRLAPGPLAMALLAAWTVMGGRVLVEVGLTDPSLLPRVAWPIGGLALGFVIAAFVFGFGVDRRNDGATVPLTNPFSLLSAARFAALFGLVQLTAAILRDLAGHNALYAVAAIAGTTDVDAITLTLAGLSGRDPEQATLAVRGITIAVVTNTVVKAGLVAALGSRAVAVRTGVAAAAGIALALAGLVIAT